MDLWVNQNQCNVLLFLILWKGKRKLKKKCFSKGSAGISFFIELLFEYG